MFGQSGKTKTIQQKYHYPKQHHNQGSDPAKCPPRRGNENLNSGIFNRPYALVIAAFYFEGVFARIEVGVVGGAGVIGLVPAFIKAFEPVVVLIFIRRFKIQQGKLKFDVFGVVRQSQQGIVGKGDLLHQLMVNPDFAERSNRRATVKIEPGRGHFGDALVAAKI